MITWLHFKHNSFFNYRPKTGLICLQTNWIELLQLLFMHFIGVEDHYLETVGYPVYSLFLYFI